MRQRRQSEGATLNPSPLPTPPPPPPRPSHARAPSVANVSLNCLNAFWFYKMIAKVVSVLAPTKAAPAAKKAN